MISSDWRQYPLVQFFLGLLLHRQLEQFGQVAFENGLRDSVRLTDDDFLQALVAHWWKVRHRRMLTHQEVRDVLSASQTLATNHETILATALEEGVLEEVTGGYAFTEFILHRAMRVPMPEVEVRDGEWVLNRILLHDPNFFRLFEWLRVQTPDDLAVAEWRYSMLAIDSEALERLFEEALRVGWITNEADRVRLTDGFIAHLATEPDQGQFLRG